MARTKHLMIIHGRSTKPSENEKKRIVREALLNGLGRVDPKAAARLTSGPKKVKLSFIYYGDISNKLIVQKSPDKKARLKGRDAKHGNARCIPDNYYDKGLKTLYAQRGQTKASYDAFLKKNRDRRWVDNAASVVSALAGLTGFSDELIEAATPDLGAYLRTRQWGSAIRDRLQQPLKRALLNNDDICLIAHSMGCIVSYDVLWKFSRMSEYRDIQNTRNKVTKWITLGNPLGEPGVRDNLYDADEPDDGLYPSKIIKDWINFSAQDDFICHDPTVKDDFRDMVRDGHVGSIQDRKMYNFWIGEKGNTNPHKLYGYLDNKAVAQEVVDWMK